MAKLGLELFFEVPDIWVNDTVLGKSITLQKSDVLIRLDIPQSPTAFEFKYASGPYTSDTMHESNSEKPKVALVDRSGPYSVVKMMRVVVNKDEDFSHGAFKQSDDEEGRNRCVAIINRFTRIARVELDAFIEWVRVYGEHVWLSPTGDLPRMVNLAQLGDLEAGYRFGPLIGPVGTLRVIGERAPLDEDDILAITSRLRAGPPLFASLSMADAKHMIEQHERSAPDRAVVLAAMACEAKVKEVGTEMASDEQAGLVTLVLKNVREIPQTPPMLMHVFLKAVTGHSLHAEHPADFRLIEELYSVRNGIVHRGETVSREKAKELVSAASRAFIWLQEIASERLGGGVAGDQ